MAQRTDGNAEPTILRPAVIVDPGDAGAIPATVSGTCALTTGGSGETRTLADPAYAGQRLALSFDVDGGGDCVVTVPGTVNQTGNNTLTGADAGDHIALEGVTVAGSPVWRVLANDGWALSTV